MSDGGKGHAPRQKRDDDAFRRNWEAIFGDKRRHESATPIKSEDGTVLGHAIGAVVSNEEMARLVKCAEPFCSCEVKDEADSKRD